MRKVVFFIFFLFLSFFSLNCFGANLTYLSDKISDSAPGNKSSHIIKFTITTSVPASGKILITPQPGAFYIPSNLDYSDLKFFVNDIEQTLGATSGSGVSGVEIINGYSGKIKITLANDLSLSSGDKIEIQIGIGQDKIYNPDREGSYKITIETYDPSENLLDSGMVFVAIVSPVRISVEIAYEEPIIETLAAAVVNEQTAILNGVIYNLGPATSVMAYFQYRVKGEERWNITYKTQRERPTVYSYILPGLQVNTTYEFRFVVDWIKEGIPTSTYGQILEFTTTPNPPGGGAGAGGGGGGAGAGAGPTGVPATQPEIPSKPPPYIIFDGWAFPNSVISLLREGEGYATTTAKSDASFRFSINEPHRGIFTFTFKTRDDEGRKAIDLSYTIETNPDKVTYLPNIIFPPTIELAKNRVVPGENVMVFGKTAPQREVTVVFIRPDLTEFSKTVISEPNGKWSATLDTTNLKEGTYRVKARVKIGREVSGFSNILIFTIGKGCLPADLNCDGRVDLLDFSILMFYWGTKGPTGDINTDGIVDLFDFSIMMAYWTG